DYRAFLRPEVDAATRSAALRKLFLDPHFNQMDGLDVYIDDYSKTDPLPSAMLRLLNQARNLRLFEEPQPTAAPPGAGEPVATPLAAAASGATLPEAAGEGPSAVPPPEDAAKPGAA